MLEALAIAGIAVGTLAVFAVAAWVAIVFVLHIGAWWSLRRRGR